MRSRAGAALRLFECLSVPLMLWSAGADQGSPSPPTLLIRSADTGHVAAMAVSPDGQWYVTLCQACQANGVATIWSARDGFEYRSFRVGESGIAAPTISVAPDGRTIAVATGDEVRFFDVNTGKQSSAVKIANNPNIARLAFHPRRMLLAILDANGTVRIRDLVANSELFRKPIDRDSGILHFSPDGSLLAAGSPNTAHIWAWEQSKEIATFHAHALHSANLNRKVRAAVLTPNGVTLEDQTGEQLGLYHFNDLVFAGVAPKLALVHKDEINVVELPEGKKLEAIPIETGEIKSCIFTGPNIIVAGLVAWDSFRYDLDTHARAAFPAWGAEQFLAIPNSNHLLINLGDKVGIKEDTGNGKWFSFTANKLASISEWHFSPSGNELVAGTFWATSPMTVWDFASGQADTLAIPVPDVGFFAFSPDGKRMAYYGSEGYPNFKIHVWNRASRSEELSVPIVVPDTRSQLVFSPDGNRLAALVGEPHAMKIWSVPDGKLLALVPSNPLHGPFLSFAWSPDGRTIAIAQEKLGILIFDSGQSSVVKTVAPEPGGEPGFRHFGAVRFSPDGKMLAAGGLDKIYLIDPSAWSVTANIPSAPGSCLDFSSDSRSLALLTGRLYSSPGVATWDLQAKKIATQDSTYSTGCPLSFRPGGELLAVSHGGGIGILSASTGEVLATLYRFGNDQSPDWLAVTADGLFDGTRSAWNQVSWRFSENTFDVAPVELFFNEYFSPGLLADIFAGKRPRAVADITKKDRRQPQIQLSVTSGQGSAGKPIAERELKLKLEVNEASADKDHPGGSGAQDVRLFRNGSLVKMWHGAVKLDAQGHAVLETSVRIVAGENQFTAYGFNHDNIKSGDATLTVTGADALMRKGTAYILAIGVDHYANQNFDLRYAVADAQVFAEELKAQQEKLGNFARVEVIPLLDAQATRANILAAFAQLAPNALPLPAGAPPALSKLQAAQPEDAVFIYFAGHGTADGPRFYLIPHDLGYSGARDAIDDAAMKTITQHSISDEELDAAFETVDAGRMVLIIDACNSGQALEAEEKRRGPMNSKGLAQLAYEKGMYILTAAQGYQQAQESNQLGHGLLTYALVEEGLKQGEAAATGQSNVNLREWLDYAVQEVPQLQMAWLQGKPKGDRAVQLKNGAKAGDPVQLGMQRPRVFYRREPETQPFIIAKP